MSENIIDKSIFFQTEITETGRAVVNSTWNEFVGFFPYYRVYYIVDGEADIILSDKSMRLKKGNIYLKRSFLVDDIFNQEQEKMASAYYASKIPQYIERLEKGLIELKSFSSIRWQLMQDMKEFNCQTLSAHNARFDVGALNQTARYLKKGWYYLPKDIEVWDSLKMSRDTICKNKTYQYRTNKGFKSATAENLYKYLSGDENFNESHTALEDALIETKILVKCLSSHKRMRKKLYED